MTILRNINMWFVEYVETRCIKEDKDVYNVVRYFLGAQYVVDQAQNATLVRVIIIYPKSILAVVINGAAKHVVDITKHANSVVVKDVLNAEVGTGRPILLELVV